MLKLLPNNQSEHPKLYVVEQAHSFPIAFPDPIQIRGYTSIIYACHSIYFCQEKNPEPLLFDPEFSLCNPDIVGTVTSPPPPPPLSGFAMRPATPPKLNPPGP